MVSGGYQLCQRSGEIHIFTTMPAVRSDEIKIEATIFCMMRFARTTGHFSFSQKEKRRGFPRRLER
jgi:hypothetical protein